MNNETPTPCDETTKGKSMPAFYNENVEKFVSYLLEVIGKCRTLKEQRFAEFFNVDEKSMVRISIEYPPYQRSEAIYAHNRFLDEQIKLGKIQKPIRVETYDSSKETAPSYETIRISRDKYENFLTIGYQYFIWDNLKLVQEVYFSENSRYVYFHFKKEDSEKVIEFITQLRLFMKEHILFKGEKLLFTRRGWVELLEYPKLDWSDVILSTQIKREFELNLLTPLNEGINCIAKGIPWRRGLLLGGPAGCHDEETLAVTPHGLKKYTEMKVGDIVLALDDDGNIIENKIKSIVEFPYDGLLKRFESSIYDFGVTFGHRMRTLDRYKKHGWKYQSANSVKKAYLSVKGNPFKGKSITMFDIHKYITVNKKLDFPLKSHMKSKLLPFRIDDFLSLIGWYISEGSIFTTERGDYTQIRQSGKYFEEIYNLLERMKLDFSIYENKTKFVIFHQDLTEYLKRCGVGSENKMVPKEILDLDSSLLQHLFVSLIKGDGSNRRETSKDYYTVSKQLRDDVIVLSLKLGYSVSFHERDRTNKIQIFDGRKITPIYPEICLHIRKNSQGWIDNRNKSEYYYEGKVWCFETEYGNFFTCRNGKIACSGNTGKTQVCRILCNQLKDVTVLWATPKAVQDEDDIAMLFDAARHYHPALIIIEDIDFIGSSRDFSKDPSLGELLNQLDGNDPNLGVFVIATTNRPEMLDSALANRPSRFDVLIEFKLPDKEVCKSLIKLFSQNMTFDKELNLENLAISMKELTGAQIKESFVYSKLVAIYNKEEIVAIDDVLKRAANYKLRNNAKAYRT